MADAATSRTTTTSAAQATTVEETTQRWLRRAGALTIMPDTGWPQDEMAVAADTAATLARIARALVDAGLVHRTDCADACGTCSAAGGSCALVMDLAALPPWSAPSESTPSSAEADLGAYRRALAAAAGAVFTCRRTLHTTGGCLFGPGDLCGRVLAATHRLG